jgi:hypothetical protein
LKEAFEKVKDKNFLYMAKVKPEEMDKNAPAPAP